MCGAPRSIVSAQQGNFQDVRHVLNNDPTKPTAERLGNLVKILFIPFWKDDGLDARPKGGQGFFL
jgi:hypothetical protein